MAGSPTFSATAATVLVDAYLAQPEGNRDLRVVLANAKYAAANGHTDGMFREADPDVVREIATMSESQAYELVRPNALANAESRIIDRLINDVDTELAKHNPDHKRLVHLGYAINSLIRNTPKPNTDKPDNGLSSLLGA